MCCISCYIAFFNWHLKTRFTYNCRVLALLFILLLIFWQPTAAQEQQASLSGTVVDQNNNPISGATVSLLQSSDSSLVKLELTGKQGFFKLYCPREGNYIITVNFLGYKKYQSAPFRVNSQSSRELAMIRLEMAESTLMEVHIRAEKQLLEMKPGKMLVNVGNSILASGKSVFDVLKTSPGVQIDNNDNLKLYGKQGVLVMLNGKPTYMEKDALNDMLKNTQSSEIEQIELISNPSAKYQAEGGGAIINIRFKKGKNMGTNGSLSLSSGLGDLGAGFEPNYKVSSGLGLNFRSKKLNIFGNYNYADNNQSRNSVMSRNVYGPEQLMNIGFDYRGTTQRLNHTYRMGADYFISPNHIVGFFINGSGSKIHIDKQNTSRFFNFDKMDTVISTAGNQNRKLNNQSFNLNYKGTLGKKAGELSVDMDYIRYDRNSAEVLQQDYFYNTNLYATISDYRPAQTLENLSPSFYRVKALKADYSLNVAAAGKFQAGIQASDVQGDTRVDFGEWTSNGLNRYPDLSDHFKIDERIAAGYVSYSRDFKKMSMELGLRAEQTYSNGKSINSGKVNKRHYLDFFPNMQLSGKLNASNQLTFTLSRRIGRPGYDYVNPFKAYLDDYNYRSGNPALQPEYTHIVELSHTFKDKYISTLRSSMINGVFFDVNEQDQHGAVTEIRRNFGKQYSYGFAFNAPMEMNSWWKIDLGLEAMYQRFTNDDYGVSFDKGSPDIILTALQAFSFKRGLSAEVYGKFESGNTYGIYHFKPAWNVDAGISKSLFHKNASIKFRVTDIFNTSEMRFKSDFSNLDLDLRIKQETRAGQLSFTWLFGKKTVKAARKRITSSDSEQKRVGNN